MTAVALVWTDAAGPGMPARRPTLNQCVLLAALLHLLAVLVLGNTEGGSARPGEGVWGAINLRLQSGAGQRSAEVDMPRPAPPPAPAPAQSLPPIPTPTRIPAPAAAPAPEPRPAAAPEAAPAAESLRELRPAGSGHELRDVAPLPAVAAPLPLPAVTAAPTPDLPPLPPPVPTRSLAPPQRLPLAAETPLPRVAAEEPISLPPATAAQPLPEIPPVAVPRGLPDAPAGEAPRSAAESLPLLRPAPEAAAAGAAAGDDVAAPAPAAASAPRLNLELVRPRGAEVSRHGSRGLLNLLPHPPERKLADDIEKSAKPDCRTAYSGLGLLAAAPLLVDAVRKDGCRW